MSQTQLSPSPRAGFEGSIGSSRRRRPDGYELCSAPELQVQRQAPVQRVVANPQTVERPFAAAAKEEFATIAA
jgi:hypothetical protein